MKERRLYQYLKNMCLFIDKLTSYHTKCFWRHQEMQHYSGSFSVPDLPIPPLKI